MSVTLVHHFKTEISTVKDVCPGVDHATVVIKQRLIKVESVEVECHGTNTKSSKPDANYRPGSKEEVKTTRVIEGSVLENKATKITVSSYNVVGLFFLSELVSVVLRFSFSCFADEGTSDQRSMHSREKRTTKYTSHPKHMEGVHEDVMLRLKNKHVVKCSANAERHTIREGTLSKGIDEENCSSSSNGCAVGNHNPRTHAQTIRQFPFTAHVGIDSDEEVEDHQLERTAIVQPLVEAGSFPDGVEVQADGIAGGNNST